MIAVGARREKWTDGVAALRRRLSDAGYDQTSLDRLLGRGGADERAARALLSDDPLAALAALFAVGVAIPESRAEAALAPVGLDDLVESDLLAREGGEVRGRFGLAEYEGLIVASDLETPSPAPDHVLGLSGSTRLTASLTIRRPVDRALDLGTGGGVHALLAAGHAGQVVGTDVNARALGVARLNAALNGISNVEWREGSFFDPVRDERFGLVVSNPPFMITPRQELLFRDGGGQRDEVSERVVAGVAELLEEGGFATVVCNWITPAEGDWQEPLRRWTAESGCDALLLKLTTETPLAYAAGECSRRAGDDSYTTAVARWLDHYRQLGIESITTGAVVLRRRSGQNWVQAEEIRRTPTRSAGDQLARIFEAHDLLAGLDDSRLLDCAFRPAIGARLVHGGTFDGVEYGSETAQLSLERGAGLDGRFSAEALPAIRSLDGRRSLRELPGGDRPATLAAVRGLAERGFLEFEPRTE